jgi:hypothetical protein
MTGKFGSGSKAQISKNIGNNYLQMIYGLSPVNKVLLGKGLGK